MIDRRYRVRWVFDFAGRPSRRGMWSEPGNIAQEGAWRVNKTGLVRAAIEVECLKTQKVWATAECDGHDFVNFEWMTAVPVMAKVLTANGVNSVTQHGDVMGLRLVTRDLMLEVLVDGQQFLKRRPEADKGLHLATFGR